MVLIDISALSSGVHEVTLHPSSGDLNLGKDEFGSIKAVVRLHIGDHQILAQLHVSANSRLICDRTLIPFTQRVSGEFSVMFTTKVISRYDTDEVVKHLDPAARELDVTEAIRDTILLAVPLRKVAPEASEAELNLTYQDETTETLTDPRWEELKKLKSDRTV